MAQRPLTTMKDNVGKMVQDTDSAFLALIQNWINDRYYEILRRLSLLEIVRLDYTFSTVAGTEDYVMPEDFGKAVTALDKTNNRQLARMDVQTWVRLYRDSIDTSGTHLYYMILDSPVRIQPTTAGVIVVVSSSASDTTQTVWIRGLDSNGREDFESLTLNGTTNVTGTKSFSRILMIAKSGDTTGVITVTRGSDTLAHLARNKQESLYKIMRLAAPPTGVATIEVIYIQKILPLENAYDYPIIACSETLETGATADAWRYKRQFAKAEMFEGLYEKQVANLAWERESNPDKVPLFVPKPYSRSLADDGRYGTP